MTTDEEETAVRQGGRRVSIEKMLAPVVPLRGRQKRKEDPLLTVYRVQLVEERRIAVPRLRVRTSAHAAQVAWRYLDRPDREHFVVLLLDLRHNLLGIHTAAVGCIDEVRVSPRAVFKAALLRNAEGVVLAHNHVSGPVVPSPADRKLTRELARAGNALQVCVHDHVILGRSARERFSFLENGLL
ncbi:MAG: DNA repair protein RadC [Gammaproteobacteria bacterium]|nr:DNA repair protein RadC [Gammaproteobacteria bacterium]NIR82378.1 DNA repair protein RadC [Gammaproteobacteria bacterium]NIU03523.1 DNA repair protein RadC [Gammaproteobacteria bacterium]NIX84797.1 DNA repair protein RadC [Gammaproteobacteria bacterium]